MSKVTWQNAGSANGPLVAAWFRQRDRMPTCGRKDGFYDADDSIASLHSAVSRWERGTPASLKSLDHWVTFIGCHLSELPDEVWRAEKLEQSNGKPHPRREEGFRLIAEGLNNYEISRRLGVARSTVRKWRTRLAPSVETQSTALSSGTGRGQESLEMAA